MSCHDKLMAALQAAVTNLGPDDKLRQRDIYELAGVSKRQAMREMRFKAAFKQEAATIARRQLEIAAITKPGPATTPQRTVRQLRKELEAAANQIQVLALHNEEMMRQLAAKGQSTERPNRT